MSPSPQELRGYSPRRSIRPLALSIIISWFTYDTILVLGTPGSIIVPFLKVFKRTKVIFNFGGFEWKRDKWNTLGKWYLKKSESVAIKHSNLMIADNQHFVNYINDAYNKKSVLIEYGGNHVSHKNIEESLAGKYPFLKTNYYLSVSRAQPDNNLHVLLDCFASVPDKILVLISNWNICDYGKELKKNYSGINNLFLVDAVYDLSELDTIRSNCFAYIHSHSFCGTAPSLVEAMNLGLPVISYDNETNRFTTENEAFFFKDADNLKTILTKILPGDLDINGKKMKAIAEKRYSWERISKLYADIF
jgi:glycosyltransferase involved in cell wall biosynthesis